MITIKKYFSSSLLRKNISFTFLRQLLVAIAQFFLIIIIAREFGPEGNGIYVMAILVPTMMVNFFNLGIGHASIYFISTKYFSNDQVLTKNILLALIISLIATILVLPLIFFKGNEIFPGIPLDFIYVGFICFPLSLMSIFLASILQGQENFNAYNLTEAIPPYVHLCGISIAIYFFETGVLGVLLSYFFSQTMALIIVLFLIKPFKILKNKKKKISLKEYSKKSIGFGFKIHFSNILTFLNYRADIFLINFFLNPSLAGVYFIAVQISEKIWIFSHSASSVLFPRFAKIKNTEERIALANRGVRLVGILTILLSILVGLILYWFLEILFGKDYVDALLIFFWLIPGTIAASGSRIYSVYITASGKPEWNMYISFFIVLANIIGNIILIPKYGILGAAWVTTTSYCLDALIKFWLARHTLRISKKY